MIAQFLILLPIVLGSDFPCLCLVIEYFTPQVRTSLDFQSVFKPVTPCFLTGGCLSAILLKRNCQRLVASSIRSLTQCHSKTCLSKHNKTVLCYTFYMTDIQMFKKVSWEYHLSIHTRRCYGHSVGCHSLPTEQVCAYC